MERDRVVTPQIIIPMTDDLLRDARLLPPEPYAPSLSRRQWLVTALRSGYWSVRWWIAEKIAGEAIHGQGDCPNWFED